uniref:Transmembrane protein 199 n=1 Tax=Eptatretus burgeri TaxID=7764 RepID=A0A8C4RBT2_EPTBU
MLLLVCKPWQIHKEPKINSDYVVTVCPSNPHLAGEQVFLHELLTGSEILLDAPPPPPPPNPSLQARLDKLRARQAAKEYRSMTRNVDCRVSCFFTYLLSSPISKGIREVIVLLLVNFLISVAAAFVCSFLISNYLFTTPTIVSLLTNPSTLFAVLV